MGCSNSSSPMLSKKDQIDSNIEKALIQNDLQGFITQIRHIKKSFTIQDFDIDTYTIPSLSSMSLTLPALSIIYGRHLFFQYLDKNFQLSIPKLELFFSNFKVSSLLFLCSKNYQELLIYYLPLYLAHLSRLTFRSSYSLSFGDSTTSEVLTTQTPIQVACSNGHIQILQIVHKSLKTWTSFPVELSIHYIDKNTGENCALIACKKKNYPMIRFLHRICKADFTVVNNRNENAVQLACIPSSFPITTELASICKYLIEEVNIDIKCNYEETLMLCKDPLALAYLKKVLVSSGIIYQSQDPGDIDLVPKSRFLNSESI